MLLIAQIDTFICVNRHAAVNNFRRLINGHNKLKRAKIMTHVTWKYTIQLIIVSISLSTAAANDTAIRISNTFDAMPSNPPYRWLEECTVGKLSIGSSQHIVDKAFKELGLNVEWLLGNTNHENPELLISQLYQKLINNEQDFLITARPPSQDNKQFITVKTPIFYRRSSIITLSDSSINTQDINSLKTYTGGAYIVTPAADLMPSPIFNYAQNHQLNLKFYSNETYHDDLLNNQQTPLKELISGEVDYVIDNHFRTKIWAYNNNVNQQLRFDPIKLTSYGVYLVTATDNPHNHLIDDINEQLKHFQTTSFIDNTHNLYLQKWLSSPCI